MKRLFLLVTAVLTVSTSFAQEVLPKTYVAKYDAYYEGKKVGTLEREFSQINENEYVLKSKSSVDGYYGFIPVSDTRSETSSFSVDNQSKYHPNHYVMNRTGTWLDFKMNILFDYTTNNVNFEYKDRKETKPIVGNVLDNALYQLRLQHDIKNGKKDVNHDIAYKTGFRKFHFKYQKNEVIETHYGNVDSIKFVQVRDNKKGSKKGVSSWFDPQRDYVMNKLIYFNDKGKEEARFELVNYQEK